MRPPPPCHGLDWVLPWVESVKVKKEIPILSSSFLPAEVPFEGVVWEGVPPEDLWIQVIRFSGKGTHTHEARQQPRTW
jgi:hypothetical protein